MNEQPRHPSAEVVRDLCAAGRLTLSLHGGLPDDSEFPLVQGLRTLVVAGKALEEDDWAAWDARYQQAAADLEHRDELVRWRSVRV
jgi:hypothetical protein